MIRNRQKSKNMKTLPNNSRATVIDKPQIRSKVIVVRELHACDLKLQTVYFSCFRTNKENKISFSGGWGEGRSPAERHTLLSPPPPPPLLLYRTAE